MSRGEERRGEERRGEERRGEVREEKTTTRHDTTKQNKNEKTRQNKIARRSHDNHKASCLPVFDFRNKFMGLFVFCLLKILRLSYFNVDENEAETK